MKIAKEEVFLIGMCRMVACKATSSEVRAKTCIEREFFPCLFIAGLYVPFRFRYFMIKRVEVFENELCFNDFDVTLGINGGVDVDDIGIVEAPDDMKNCVDVAYVREKLIAETIAFVGAADKAGNINKLKSCRNGFRGPEDLCESVESIVGDGDNANVWVDRAEGIIGYLCSGGRDGVEESRFSNIGESDYTAGKAHISFTLQSNGICRS